MAKQIIYVIKAVQEAMLFVCIYLKFFRMPGCYVGYGLLLKVHTYHSGGIIHHSLGQLIPECRAHGNRKYKAIEQVAAMDIGKSVRYYDPDAIAGNSPCRMLTAGTGAPVCTGNHNLM